VIKVGKGIVTEEVDVDEAPDDNELDEEEGLSSS